jgi:hypothetical protein
MAPEHVYSSFYSDNKDSRDPRYNTKYSLYASHCGLANVLMSFGHDGTRLCCKSKVTQYW